LFLEECIHLYKNNSTSKLHRFNYVKTVSYRNLPTEPWDVTPNVKNIFFISLIYLFRSVKAQAVKIRSLCSPERELLWPNARRHHWCAIYLYFKGPFRFQNVKFDQCAKFTLSPCKTFSSRVIHKIFSADNLFKAKYNNFC
jgi:hypothetical protein